MYRVLALAALLAAGCCNVVGPVEHYRNYVPPDNPCLPISEQEKRGRDRLALPEYDPRVAPGTDPIFPGQFYGR